MKKLLTLASATLLSTQTLALSNDVKFVAADTDLATDLCLVAAKDGYFAAKVAVKNSADISINELPTVSCNGLSIKRFAKKFATVEVESVDINKVNYQFKAIDDSEATQICYVAAQQGIKQAKELAGSNADAIICNGRSLTSFARKYKNS